MIKTFASITKPEPSVIPHRANSAERLFASTLSFSGGLLQPKAACACGGGGPRSAEEMRPETLQTKSRVGTPGDEYEQEADRVADQVMRAELRNPSFDKRCDEDHRDVLVHR